MNTTVREGLLAAAGNDMHVGLAPTTVLVPLLNLRVADEMLPLAGMLAAGRPQPISPGQPLTSSEAQPHVVVLGVVEVPSDQPLAAGLDMVRSYRALLDFLPTEIRVADHTIRVDHVVKAAHDISSAVRQAALDEKARVVLLYWKGHASKPKQHLYGRTLDAILRDPPCDVILARPEGWHDTRRILLPVRGGPTAEQALDVALALSAHTRLPMTVLHVTTTPNARQNTQESGEGGTPLTLGEEPYLVFTHYLEAAKEATSLPVQSVHITGEDPAAALLAQAQSDDLVIMSMAALPGKAETADRSIPLTIAREKGPPMLLLRSTEPSDLVSYTRKGRARRKQHSHTDASVEHWFVENTYHADEFKDPEEFLKLKKAAGLTISVALLTFNDAKQIYSIITGLKRVLQEMHPIAEQIAVVDAGSSDDTVEIARSLGAEVYLAQEILPEQGHFFGHGESWWKSLAVLRGDVLVWLDPRAQRFHPTTALALAGPLLRTPSLQLVKAFGPTHPHADGGREQDEAHQQTWPPQTNWGGHSSMLHRRDPGLASSYITVQPFKATDLLALDARQLATLPLQGILPALCPQLAGVIAPFGRDMAGRRASLLSMPAFVGEHLEVGLLLSVVQQHGAHSLAQVELRQARPAPPPHTTLPNAIDLCLALSVRLQDPNSRRAAARLAQRLHSHTEPIPTPYPHLSTPIELRLLPPAQRPPMLPHA